MQRFEKGEVIYENPLAKAEDVAGFIREGEPIVSFPQGVMRLENGKPAAEGQKANYLFWCPETFPADFHATWSFKPIREPGLAMFWFAANGQDGKDLFDPSLAPRHGDYKQYHHGDINAYHLSYFRRKNPSERAFTTCNMRKSYGFHLVCQGGDPIPSVPDVEEPYQIEVYKCGPTIQFFINELPIFEWVDDGTTYGPLLGTGRIGFRQMAPLIAEYGNLVVRDLRPASD